MQLRFSSLFHLRCKYIFILLPLFYIPPSLCALLPLDWPWATLYLSTLRYELTVPFLQLRIIWKWSQTAYFYLRIFLVPIRMGNLQLTTCLRTEVGAIRHDCCPMELRPISTWVKTVICPVFYPSHRLLPLRAAVRTVWAKQMAHMYCLCTLYTLYPTKHYIQHVEYRLIYTCIYVHYEHKCWGTLLMKTRLITAWSKLRARVYAWFPLYALSWYGWSIEVVCRARVTRVGRGRGRGRGRVVPCKSSLVYWSPSITRTAITHIPLINDPLRLRTLVASQQQQVHPSSVTTVYTLHVMYSTCLGW